MTVKKQCITPGCKKMAMARGLCQSCYMKAYQIIGGDLEIDQKLVDSGRILAPSRHISKERKWLLEGLK